MGRSPLFAEVARALRIAQFCNDHRLPTPEGLDRIRQAEARQSLARRSRRDWLKTVAHAGVAGAAACVATPVHRLFANAQSGAPLDVGIVGAGPGRARLRRRASAARASAPRLRRRTRAPAAAAGRCAGCLPGPGRPSAAASSSTTCTRRCSATRSRFGLAREDVSKEPGEVFYYLRRPALLRSPRSSTSTATSSRAMRDDLPGSSSAATARLAHRRRRRRSIARTSPTYLEGQNGAGRRPHREGGHHRGVRRRVRPARRPSRAASTSCSSSTPTGARSSRRSASSATSATTSSTATTGSPTAWRRGSPAADPPRHAARARAQHRHRRASS